MLIRSQTPAGWDEKFVVPVDKESHPISINFPQDVNDGELWCVIHRAFSLSLYPQFGLSYEAFSGMEFSLT